MSEDPGASLAGLLLYVFLVLAIVFIIVYIIVHILLIAMGIGALWGGGNAVFNYATAFRNNVKLERA
jgi:hypothetical protein